jgi:hypothetical protein
VLDGVGENDERRGVVRRAAASVMLFLLVVTVNSLFDALNLLLVELTEIVFKLYDVVRFRDFSERKRI